MNLINPNLLCQCIRLGSFLQCSETTTFLSGVAALNGTASLQVLAFCN
jgi:hypothetical protein